MTAVKKIAIVDYGLANIRSVQNALSCFPVDVVVCETGAELAGADGIILPGVGSYDAGMNGLRERGHETALGELVLEKKVPFFGICLGLQFLFESSAEGKEKGLGWFPGGLKRFPSGPDRLKVPHIGWNDLELARTDGLFRGLEPPFTFYFVHSYYLPDTEELAHIASGRCEYGLTFLAAVEHENIMATQFHPEKSQMAGLKLISNFLEGI